MAGTLKQFFSAALVKRLAADVVRVHPSFPSRRFQKQACTGLERLELLDRGRHIARALAAHLPPEYPKAVDVLLRSLGPEHATDELLGAGMAPFFYFPHTVFVAERGLEHFEHSMRAQYELTKRFSAEASIRPYLDRYPEQTLAVLRKWSRDGNAHVRRLVSEGTRLRLPWAPRVAWLEAHPERVVELIGALKDDPATLVRRSVANSLNDLHKLRPDLLAATAEAWLKDASPERRALVEHALRGAVRRGDGAALRLLGYGARAEARVEKVRFVPARVAIGGRVVMSFTLRSLSRRKQSLLVNVAVYFVKTRGATAKVFKVGRLALPPGASLELEATFSLAVHTTRVPRPGRHQVDVLLNGEAHRAGAFQVTGPRAAVNARRSGR